MARRRTLRTTLLAGLVATIVVAVVRVLRRPDLHGTLQSDAAREAADASGRPAPLPAPGPDAPVIEPGPGLTDMPDDASVDGLTADGLTAAAGTADAAGTDAAAGTVGAAWVAPLEGACPEGYEVKAKVSSRIFHVPGSLAYERTRPDRCYRSPADAEADGFRAAKR